LSATVDTGGSDSSIRAFIVTVPTDDVDLASDRLWQLGVRAIEERAGSGGAVDLRTSVGRDEAAIVRAVGMLDPRWSWRTEDVSTAAAETWREYAAPNWITDDLVIVPEWLDLELDDGVTRVVIEPAGAFGLGDHPTSQLSARALRRELARRDAGDGAPNSVLDVGCGTGVLSIVAALSGAPRVRAIDISADAIAATVANARRNGVADVIEVDDAAIGRVAGHFDIVVANVLAPELVSMAPDLRRLVADDGRLVISGILADAHDHVLEALRPMVVVERAAQDNWSAVTLGHGTGAATVPTCNR
jgi:ribosomal protein L11 methyltransferase